MAGTTYNIHTPARQLPRCTEREIKPKKRKKKNGTVLRMYRVRVSYGSWPFLHGLVSNLFPLRVLPACLTQIGSVSWYVCRIYTPLFRFRFGHCFILSFSCGYYVCCLIGFGFCRDSFSIWYVWWYVLYVRWSHLLFLSEVYDLFMLLCIDYLVFFQEVIFPSRIIAACPVTTDCIVAMRWCENNNLVFCLVFVCFTWNHRYI